MAEVCWGDGPNAAASGGAMLYYMMWHALRLLRTKYRAAGAAFRSELAFRKRHPDALVTDGVLLFGAERISAGRRLFLDRRAYLNTGTLNDRGGYIRMGDNVEIGPYAVLWGAGGI
ncbi:MAG: hypothetical protein ACYC8W_12190, partial [Candidatus Tyrphobacter sp.]